MSQFEDDRSQRPAAVAGTPDRLTARAVRALDMYLRYEAAVTRHVALLEAVQSAHAHQTAILEAITMAWASRADAAAARASLREAMRLEVAALRSAAVPPEHILRLIHDGVAAAGPEAGLPHDDVDQLRGEMVQWGDRGLLRGGLTPTRTQRAHSTKRS